MLSLSKHLSPQDTDSFAEERPFDSAAVNRGFSERSDGYSRASLVRGRVTHWQSAVGRAGISVFRFRDISTTVSQHRMIEY